MSDLESGGPSCPTIEFFGPPGAGKSTVYEGLVHDPRFFDGRYESFGRMFSSRSPMPVAMIYRWLPTALRRSFDTLVLKHRYRQQALASFVCENPRCIEAIASAIESMSWGQAKFARMALIRAASQRLSTMTVHREEFACVDEGFVQLVASMAWRLSDHGDHPDTVFRACPPVDYVVYLDTCVETCLDRQRRRGNVVDDAQPQRSDPMETQRTWHRLCRTIVEDIPSGTEVIHVRNEGDPTEALATIKRSILN